MIYYVIELQSGDSGAGLITAYTNKADAEEAFHDKAKYAVKSGIRKHGVIMVNEDGFVCKDPEVYEHGATQATPETPATTEPEGQENAE